MRLRSLISLLAVCCGYAEASDSHKHTDSHKHEAAGAGSANVPQLAPRPDSSFALASAWDGDTAEILIYSVQRGGAGENGKSLGELVTERLFLEPGGMTGRAASTREDVEILNAALACTWNENGSSRSRRTVVKLPRRGSFRLLRQDQSLQSRSGVAHRILDNRANPPRLRAVSSGSEPGLDTALAQWPVYTEEMLFTYLRAVPQRAGYREEVWLLDETGPGRPSARPGFAAITVRSKSAGVRDMDTWHVTVDREIGRRSEFWVSNSGMHPVVLAMLADGSVWTLQEISRGKNLSR